jgi:hypothetical protein
MSILSPSAACAAMRSACGALRSRVVTGAVLSRSRFRESSALGRVAYVVPRRWPASAMTSEGPPTPCSPASTVNGSCVRYRDTVHRNWGRKQARLSSPAVLQTGDIQSRPRLCWSSACSAFLVLVLVRRARSGQETQDTNERVRFAVVSILVAPLNQSGVSAEAVWFLSTSQVDSVDGDKSIVAGHQRRANLTSRLDLRAACNAATSMEGSSPLTNS